MTRRVALALFAALALLAVPTAASALPHTAAPEGHRTSGTTLAPRHTTDVHVVLAARRGHERRAPHHSGFSLAVLGRSVGVAPALAWARLTSITSSPARDVPSSSRPRAPPAVV